MFGGDFLGIKFAKVLKCSKMNVADGLVRRLSDLCAGDVVGDRWGIVVHCYVIGVCVARLDVARWVER